MSAYCPSYGHKLKVRWWMRLRLHKLFRIRCYFDCMDCGRIFSKKLKDGDEWTWTDENLCRWCKS